MILDSDGLKTVDYSKLSADHLNLRLKNNKLTTNGYLKRDVTLGVLSSVKYIKAMHIRDINNNDTLFKVPMEHNNTFAIYREKYNYLKDLIYMNPTIFNNIRNYLTIYYDLLKDYRVITHTPKLKSLENIFEFLATQNYPIETAHKHIQNLIQDSHIYLNVSSKNKFLPAFSIRLPIRDYYVIRILIFPKNETEYYYVISKPAGKGNVNRYYLIDNIESYTKFINNTLYSNIYYIEDFKQLFGIESKDDITDEHYNLYSMMKI